MSGNDQKLTTDHKNVVDIIRKYEKINLINTSGEPVDEYDIEYKIKGYSHSADGSVKVSKRHRIKIKLPFGYPHFHPTVKPLSPIFHPDIDDHAIRIAHHWDKDKSLPDLVLHIGEMICGKFYTTDNPFNTEAAEYYTRHEATFPLDSLENPKKKEKAESQKEPLQLDFLAPLLKVAALLVAAALLGAGGLYFFEKSKIDATTKVFGKAQSYAHDQEYKIAESTAQKALQEIEGYLLLKSAGEELRLEISTFLNSKSMQEGLQGKIKYEDEYLDIETVHKLEVLQQMKKKAQRYAENGDLRTAIEEYENALDYAVKNDLQRGIADIKKDLADIKLNELVAASEKAHQSKDWEWAIREHKKVIDYISREKQYLKDAEKHLTKTSHLLLIDQIALYSKLGLEAEEKNDLEGALESYRLLISIIDSSGSENKATMKSTRMDAVQKAAVLKEKVSIKKQREWLLANYKEIFQVYYPTSLAAALRSPQALFVKYNGKNLVYDLSCLEKSGGSVVRLRIYYQYNPASGEWSVYDGEI